jgi:hypothetical protein
VSRAKPVTPSQRAAKSRAKRLQTAGRRVEVIITPEAAAALDRLKPRAGTISATISGALVLADAYTTRDSSR